MKIQTIILCGGTGYRLKEETEFKPKPMVEVGGKPILWHIMKIYEYWGFKNFIIALGYKGNFIKDYFINKKYYDGNFTVNSKTGMIKRDKIKSNDNFKITFADTGIESLTGERVRRLRKYIREDFFMLTYGDGLADINLKDLVQFHLKQKVWATVTSVSPILKYGGFKIGKNHLAKDFEKKTHIRQSINGGFMVINKKVLDMIEKNSMIEDIFQELILKKRLSIYDHKGFFHAMDTYQDMADLNAMWEEDPVWKKWKD